MKYVVLKNPQGVLCVQLPEGFGTKLEIVCFEDQTEFEIFLKENRPGICQICLAKPVSETEESVGDFAVDSDGFFIRQNDYYNKVLFADIAWIEASRSYSYIHLTDKSSIVVTYPLSDVKKKLPPELFIQIHRSYLINMKYVNKFIGNMLYIEKQSFPISRKFKQEVLSHFLFLDNIKNTLGKEHDPSGDKNEQLGNFSSDENSKNLILEL